MTKSDVLRRIAKLLDLAGRNAGNEAEAEAAAAKAQELLHRHNLDQADVQGRIPDEADPMTEQNTTRPGARTVMWERDLFFATARGMGCKGVFTRPGYNCPSVYHFLGRESAVAVARYVFDYLRGALADSAAKAWKARKAEGEGDYMPNGRAWKNDFLRGAVGAIGSRFIVERKRQKTESEKSRALVVVNDGAVKAYLAKRYPRLSSCRPASHGQGWGDARERGQAAGNSIPIRPAVTSNSRRQLPG